MKKILTMILFVSTLCVYAQQGPSIRLEGDLPKYGIPVANEPRSIVSSGATISNGIMTVSNLVVTTSIRMPGPLVTQNIMADTINATNSLTLKGVPVATVGMTNTVYYFLDPTANWIAALRYDHSSNMLYIITSTNTI